MKNETRHWRNGNWISFSKPELVQAQLVLVFGETHLLTQKQLLQEIQNLYPQAYLMGCSTSGEIIGTEVHDDAITITAVQFSDTKINHGEIDISNTKNSYEAGKALALTLPPENLAHIFVLSTGMGVNGSELVRGLTSVLNPNVTITGGLAGDQDRFQETWVLSGHKLSSQMVAAVGFYGSSIKIKSASLGGWDCFGPERLVTKSSGNVLYELDNKSALQIYKSYLGEHAEKLPGNALLFPLHVRMGSKDGLVRTVLSIDEKNQSMTFAGDIPEGAYVRLMKANFDRLIEGAVGAAENCAATEACPPNLAILISCVGRKLILKQRVEEEVEGVRNVFGDKTTLTGFYSYGEISPFTPGASCELHNQTMTITTFNEDEKKDAA